MHKVKRLKVGGFRRLRDVDIEMRPLMVMIGANGVGKSSLLDAISLFSASAAGALNKTLSDMGGVADVITHGYAGDITFMAQMEVEGQKPLEYSLNIEPVGFTHIISREILSQEIPENNKPFMYIETVLSRDLKAMMLFGSHQYETVLSQEPRNAQSVPAEFRRVLSSVTKYHTLDVGRRAPVKLPQPMKPAEHPGENGEDLVTFLYYLRETNHDRYEAIEDTLKAAFPGFEMLNFPPVAAGTLGMTWKDKNFKDPLYMHQLSEGTLRFLWLVSLLQSPNLPTITMIDEPEVSLHPELLNLLAETMREASLRTQVIVATHSDRLIRFLEPNEVVAMDINDEGFAEAKWADSLDLEEWMKDYSLDDLWRMGRMGGRS
jgi:predicted ATPase